MEKYFTPHASFIIGDYKVVVLEKMSLELVISLRKFSEALLTICKDKDEAFRLFLWHVATDLYFPVHVIPLNRPYDD